MEEIYNNQSKKGFLLIASLFVLSTMIIIVSFYLSAVLQEIRISNIVDASSQAYYLAEAGIQEAFWKLQNDSAYKSSFENSSDWSATFTRNDSIVPNGSYTVTIQNMAQAHALITATSTISVRDAQSQRVLKADAFKALNESPVDDVALFSNENISSIGSKIQVIGGGLFTNNNLDLKFFSDWEVEQDASAVENIQVGVSSSLNALSEHDKNSPPIPSEIQTPQIDFDSDDMTSLKSRADSIYTKQEFMNLLEDFPVIELDGIIYVTGDVSIKKGHSLTVNGTLVADGSISVANGFSNEESPANLYVYKQEGIASGVISKKNITFGGFNANIYIEGLVYSGGSLRIQDGIFQNVSVAIEGGLIAQDINALVSWNPITITLNQANINEALGTALFSQVLFINHWEEEY